MIFAGDHTPCGVYTYMCVKLLKSQCSVLLNSSIPFPNIAFRTAALWQQIQFLWSTFIFASKQLTGIQEERMMKGNAQHPKPLEPFDGRRQPSRTHLQLQFTQWGPLSLRLWQRWRQLQKVYIFTWWWVKANIWLHYFCVFEPSLQKHGLHTIFFSVFISSYSIRSTISNRQWSCYFKFPFQLPMWFCAWSVSPSTAALFSSRLAAPRVKVPGMKCIKEAFVDKGKKRRAEKEREE